jgi:hypothetical protein
MGLRAGEAQPSRAHLLGAARAAAAGSRPADRGWLADVAGTPVNFGFNALAAVTLLADARHAPPAAGIGRLLVDARGLRLDPSSAIRQDNSLQAWPWVDGTFSWVEPTAWCLLLLKKLRGALEPGAAERIGIGEQMLRDRACAEGGWNYGSSNVYGQELFPYVPTTALGLIAMQDRRDDPVVARALGRLRTSFRGESTPIALALTIVALAIHGVSVAEPTAGLVELLNASPDGHALQGLAMSLYALTVSDHGVSAFTV